MDSFEAEPRDVSPDPNDATAVGVRQGVISGRVLTVLVSSTCIAIVAMFVAWLVFR
jgi:hypothetical protein